MSSASMYFSYTVVEVLFVIRDRPFNLKGGGYGFLFRSEMFFRTTQELEYLLFLSRKARNFVPEFNIRLYDKNSESDYLFFLHQNQNIFFSNTEKTITPPSPFKLNGRSLKCLFFIHLQLSIIRCIEQPISNYVFT